MTDGIEIRTVVVWKKVETTDPMPVRYMWGYKSMVYAVMVLGFLAFIVWAHHMYLTGMGAVVSTFFQTSTVLISIPSVTTAGAT